MDFIEGFPLAYCKQEILVVINRLNIYAHFIAMRYLFTGTTVTEVFIYKVHKLHGTTVSIVNDRGSTFCSTLWKHIFNLIITLLL